MTVPEQLQAWRVKFESRYNDDQLKRWIAAPQTYKRTDVADAFETYVEAREDALQETEQAIKDARKQALEDAIAICDARINQYNAPVSDGLLSKWQVLMVKTEGVGASDCKDAIQELLK